MSRRNALKMICLVVVSTTILMTNRIAWSQTTSSESAPLVVAGRVVDVFKSASNTQHYVVQLLVLESNARWNAASAPPVDFPGPGDCLYAHVQTGNRSTANLPRPNMIIEASLRPASGPQWNAAETDWFRETGAATASVTPSLKDDLGVRVESTGLPLRRALKVTEVVPDGPGAKAGIEVGDVLVEADGVALKSPEQWSEAVRRANGQMKLLVRDVRSGRDVPVDVAWNTDNMSAPTGGAGRSLGVKTELAFFGGKPVLKVTSVDNGSPAMQSGISPGMLILSAGGIAASSPEKLEQVVSQAGNSVDLEIVADPAAGQSRDVRVRLR